MKVLSDEGLDLKLDLQALPFPISLFRISRNPGNQTLVDPLTLRLLSTSCLKLPSAPPHSTTSLVDLLSVDTLGHS